jgi:hypothetical protein
MSGVVIGSGPTTIRFRQIGIRRDRKKASEKLRAEDPGGTTLKSPDVRRDPAFRRNSDTLIMASASFAVGLAKATPPKSPVRVGMMMHMNCRDHLEVVARKRR